MSEKEGKNDMDIPDIQRVMPDSLAHAIYGTKPSPAREPEEIESFNPWVPNPRKIKYVPDDFDETTFQAELVHPSQFVKTPAAPPTPIELRATPYQDLLGDDDEERTIRDAMPIRKLFYGGSDQAEVLVQEK